ncbi:hypothetical protein SIPHO075v1_p0058 [Vibrio phage PS65A.1]|nr:hypothetical protein SIPHO075v1_p0058 [Vibrio phage PS65A.1]
MKNVSTLLTMIAVSEAMSARSSSGSQNPTRQPKERKAYYTVDSPEVKRMSKPYDQ